MTDVQIKQFRQILFWPLEIEKLSARVGQQESELRIHEFETHFTKERKWKRQPNLLSRTEEKRLEDPSAPDAAKEAESAELLYFLPAVRRFLYGPGPTVELGDEGSETEFPPPLRLYCRDDIKKASVALMVDAYHCTINLGIDRVHFYLFQHGVALLVIEVSAENLALSQAEEFLDSFRHAYPPYWETKSRVAGHCLERVRWNDYSNAKGSHFDCTVHFRNFAVRHKSPLPFEHWQYLLQPLVPWQTGLPPKAMAYRQVEGDGMPFMAYLAVEDPGLLTRANFVRLGFADGTGDPSHLPYSEESLQGFDRLHCHDKYWDPKMKYVEDASIVNLAHNWMTTRYLCCGNGFVMIGKDRQEFFADRKNGELARFRRHYFQMGLLAHYQRAALSLLSDALAEAAAKLPLHDPEPFRTEVHQILERFYQFTHQAWFREVSQQRHAQALFSLWTRQLENQLRFDQLSQAALHASQLLLMQDRHHQATVTTRLAVVATVGLAGGLVGIYLAVDWVKVFGLAGSSLAATSGDGRFAGVVALSAVTIIALAVWQSELLAQAFNDFSLSGARFFERTKNLYRRMVAKTQSYFQQGR